MAPSQWLWDLNTNPDGYTWLLFESGNLAVAAHRLAQARCEARPVSTSVPTKLELAVAAQVIIERTGIPATVPSSSLLALDCEAAGLPVL